jgi:hypothetical protein
LEVGAGKDGVDLLFQQRAHERGGIDVDDVELRLVDLVLGRMASSSVVCAVPGCTASRLPRRSLGVLMPEPSMEMIAKPFVCRMGVRIFTGAPFERICIAAGASAKATSVWPVATNCAVVADPLPSSIVRSMPASL